MQSVDTFSITKFDQAYAVNVGGLRPDGENALFLFDTGACVSLVGLNSLVDQNFHRRLGELLQDEIQKNHVTPRQNMPKTVTQESLEVYPCKCDGVSIAAAAPITFYFHIYLGIIDLPILGFDYIDDCSYHHEIGGKLIVSAIAKNVGKRFYPEKVIDFNKVKERFQSQII